MINNKFRIAYALNSLTFPVVITLKESTGRYIITTSGDVGFVIGIMFEMVIIEWRLRILDAYELNRGVRFLNPLERLAAIELGSE